VTAMNDQDQAREAARAAMRAIARTVTDAPPLRLLAPDRASRQPAPARRPQHRPAHRGPVAQGPARRRPGFSRHARSRGWIAPLAAAAAIILVAVGLVIAHQVQNGPVSTPAQPRPPAHGAGACSGTSGAADAAAAPLPSDMPQYFVALCGGPKVPPQSGGRLVAANIRTGAILGSVAAPSGKYIFNAIFGAADDRTFLLDTYYGTPKGPQDVPWALRLAPGTAHPVTLTRLPWSFPTRPQAAAISPDGTEIAVESSEQLPGPTLRMPVRLYSLATGAILRTWVLSGFVDQLQWSGDGRALLYATGLENTLIMVHPIATPGSDLAAGSTLLLTIPDPGTMPPGGPAQCLSLGSLWGVSRYGTTLTCAALNQTAAGSRPSPGSRGQSCTGGHPARLAFLRYSAVSQLAGTDYSVTAPCSSRSDTAALWWASADGTEVIGQLTYPGHNEIGLFHDNTYIALPALDSTAKSVPWDITF
jgi:hypothetical protein